MLPAPSKGVSGGREQKMHYLPSMPELPLSALTGCPKSLMLQGLVSAAIFIE